MLTPKRGAVVVGAVSGQEGSGHLDIRRLEGRLARVERGGRGWWGWVSVRVRRGRRGRRGEGRCIMEEVFVFGVDVVGLKVSWLEVC